MKDKTYNNNTWAFTVTLASSRPLSVSAGAVVPRLDLAFLGTRRVPEGEEGNGQSPAKEV